MNDEITTERKVEETKNLRVEIDRVINEAKGVAEGIGRDSGGREISLVITKLQEAKMWAGKILGELGQELPEEYRDEAK